MTAKSLPSIPTSPLLLSSLALRGLVQCLIIFSLSLCYFVVDGQDGIVDLIKVVPAADQDGVRHPAISYPVFKLKNELLNRRINDKVKNDFKSNYGIQEARNVDAMVKEAAKQGLSEINFKLLRNDEHYFSFYLGLEGVAAYPTHSAYYYCFSKYTQNYLTLDSLISPAKRKSFQQMLRQKQKDNIRKYKNRLAQDVKKGKLQKQYYDMVMSEVKEDCWQAYNPANFKVYSNSLSVMLACPFPHAVEALAPPAELMVPRELFRQYANVLYKDL